MTIFVAVRHSNNPAFYYGALWSNSFCRALRELGHQVIESEVDLLPSSRFMDVADNFTAEEVAVRATITERILEEVRSVLRREPIDLFLSYFYNAHFDPAGYDKLRQLGIPSVNFYCNSIYQFSLVSSIAAKADFSWHAEREARSAYCAVNAKPIWVQMGADPVICHPLGGMKRMVKACFIGQRYADRDRWLAALLDAKVPLDVFGSGWGAVEPSSLEVMPGEESVYLGRPQMRPGSYSAYWRAIRQTIQSTGVVGGIARLYEQHRYRTKSRLLDERMREVARGRASNMAATFAQYEVVLNLSNVWADGKPGSALISHVRLRDFEAPMTRSCYLTGHTEELEEFYEIGREIDTYRSLEEFVDKTRFYLATPAAADALREAGYRRAVRDHTWVRRFEELFRKIGMPGI